MKIGRHPDSNGKEKARGVGLEGWLMERATKRISKMKQYYMTPEGATFSVKTVNGEPSKGWVRKIKLRDTDELKDESDVWKALMRRYEAEPYDPDWSKHAAKKKRESSSSSSSSSESEEEKK